MSSSTTGTTPSAKAINSGPDPELRPAVGLLGGVDAFVVAHADTPVVGAAGWPLPVVRATDLVVVADFLDLGGVLDDAAVRADEIAEHVVAGAMAPRSPHGRVARVLQAADAAHHAIQALHFEGNVVQRREAAARVGDAVVRAVAAHEAHDLGAIGKLEAELLDREAFRRVGVLRVQDDVRELDRPVALGRQRRGGLLEDEAIGLAIRALHLALFLELGPRRAEGDAANRGRALLEADDVGQRRGAAQLAIADARQAPDVLEECRRLRDVGHAQLDALQLHERLASMTITM